MCHVLSLPLRPLAIDRSDRLCPLTALPQQGEWSKCTAACENESQRTFNLIQAQSGQGKKCVPGAHCRPGDGDCKAGVGTFCEENSQCDSATCNVFEKKCVPAEVCTPAVKAACKAGHAAECKSGSKDCGECVVGYVEQEDGKCVKKEVCVDAVDVLCASKFRKGCSPGSTACGDCLAGYEAKGGDCVKSKGPEVCTAAAKADCAAVHKEDCKSGSTDCGDCIAGFEKPWLRSKSQWLAEQPTKVDPEEVNAKYKFYTDEYHLNADLCFKLEICSTNAKRKCRTAHREPCSAGSKACGDCLAGYLEQGGECAKQGSPQPAKKSASFDELSGAGRAHAHHGTAVCLVLTAVVATLRHANA